MKATVQLLTGPAGSGKTSRLLERYAAVAQTRPGAALWLGPTRRAVESIREGLANLAPNLLSPLLATFEDFAIAIIRANDSLARPLSRVQRRLLADDIVAEMHLSGELSHFAGVADTRGFAEGVFDLLGELKRHEIWPAQLARAAYRRGYRGANVEQTFNGQDISAKERQCVRIYARYQQHLARHRLYDLEGRLWYARDLLRRGRFRPFEGVKVVFMDGFTDFTRTQREILESLAQRTEEIWLALADEPGEERSELFARPRALQNLLTERASQSLVTTVLDVTHPGPERATGLVHIERHLFRPQQQVRRSSEANGLQLIEAPGLLGEVRLVAREIKTLLLGGCLADQILVTARDLLPYVDLVREVFAEYGVPLDVEGAEPLLRNPIVAALFRAVRLPEDGWTFAGVTALLRSTYFSPKWEELQDAPDRVLRAEALLRLLGEPRGREAYLKAVDRWAEKVPEGPADEQAEVSRRLRIHRLSLECRPFLRRFFRAWDDAPHRAPLAEHLAWLRRFAENLGLTRVAEEAQAVQALERLWDELHAWEQLEAQLHGAPRPLDRGAFFRTLTAIAAEAGLARSPRGPGRVRFLSAELASTLSAEVVFLLGLGERSFPRLAAAEPIFDEAERQALKAAGLALPCMGDRRPDEMLLFYTLVTRARRQLVLSYPAVDEKGQSLLPSSFLSGLLDLFEPGAVPVLRRQMLLDGYGSDTPLSPAEHRVRAARLLATGGRLPAGLPRDLASQLRAAALIADRRFRSQEYGPYDGRLRHTAVISELQDRFGGERVLSPTALETYIACPFRFLLEHVLHLEPLEEPREDIEGTDRGLVFHRALAWLHRRLKEEGVHAPNEAVDALLLGRLDEEVTDHARHTSLAAEALWRLEGERLRRKAALYRRHWQEFVTRWEELKIYPQPRHFEKSFGVEPAEGEEPLPPLIIDVEGLQVRLGGRIDRVDVAETESGTFFWIVDYKTGRASNYAASSLRSFQRLQLALYALAVERVLLAGVGARPLGLAYWLVTDKGAKVVLPTDRKNQNWFRNADEWGRVRGLLEGVVGNLVKSIRTGDFPLRPRSDDCTQTCSFSQICRIAQSRNVPKEWELTLPSF